MVLLPKMVEATARLSANCPHLLDWQTHSQGVSKPAGTQARQTSACQLERLYKRPLHP
jgi:hypothetical protein